MFLHVVVNKSINMAKQLYHIQKNIEIYLYKLYIGTYYEVHNVINTHKNIASVITVLTVST